MKTNKTLLAICALIFGVSGIAFAQNTVPSGGQPKPFTLPKRETFQLKNGMRVTLVPYGAIPKVAISAIVHAGNINEAGNKVWLADLTGMLMKEGTATRSATQLAEEASMMGGSLSISAGDDSTYVGGDVLSAFAPQFFALLADVLQRPALPYSELARLKNDLLRQLTIAKSQPNALAYERFRQILYPDHPYGRVYSTEAVINGFTIEDVRGFYRDNFGAARTHIYVVGKFDPSAMRKIITQSFEGWTSGSEYKTNVPKPNAARTLQLIDRPDSSQSTLYVGLPTIDPSSPDYIPFAVTNSLLGESFSSRITQNIRENKGYTYAPWSQHSIRYRDAYWVEIADVSTAVTGASLKEIFYEINRLRKEAPSAEELSGIKNYMAGTFVRNNSSRQGVIS
ncbi:MAG TPA: pitrilysin family protein, partial [Pyrinomonadaceae bacterium]|nr:pitrilysin family protein [Pyrinomonadaceae bacterium]